MIGFFDVAVPSRHGPAELLSEEAPQSGRLMKLSRARSSLRDCCARTIPISTKLTWTQEISRIVFKRCVGCHNSGPASFTTTKMRDPGPRRSRRRS